MRLSRFAPLLLALAATSIAAQQTAPIARRAPPKLIVVISVDQFSADLFAQYRNRFIGGSSGCSTARCFPAAIRATPRPRHAPAIRRS